MKPTSSAFDGFENAEQRLIHLRELSKSLFRVIHDDGSRSTAVGKTTQTS